MGFLKKQSSDKPSFLPKFSDADLLKAVIKTSLWRKLYQNEKGCSWMILKALFLLKLEMFAGPIRTIFRYKIGKRNLGIIITYLSVLMMLALNTKHWSGYVASFLPFVSPALPFVMSPNEMLLAVIKDIRSEVFLWFICGYLIIVIIHFGVAYFDHSKNIKTTSRGESWLYLILFRHLRVSNKWTQVIIEPLIAIISGYFLFIKAQNVFGLFLIASGLSVFMQEFYNSLHQYLIDL